MKNNYSIKEILDAVDELQSLKKLKNVKLDQKKTASKDFSAVPKDTLKLIEEAEKNKH